MSDEEQKSSGPGNNQTPDAEIEREIRSQRKFSISEAIGRSAGDLMKGASPITRKQQAEFEIKEILERDLEDAEGALIVALLRRVAVSEALLERYDEPLGALTRVIEGILESDDTLQRFVAKVDAEWGRIYLERPHFETDQQPPDSDDPYTLASVRSTLTTLLARVQSPNETPEE